MTEMNKFTIYLERQPHSSTWFSVGPLPKRIFNLEKVFFFLGKILEMCEKNPLYKAWNNENSAHSCNLGPVSRKAW